MIFLTPSLTDNQIIVCGGYNQGPIKDKNIEVEESEKLYHPGVLTSCERFTGSFYKIDESEREANWFRNTKKCCKFENAWLRPKQDIPRFFDFSLSFEYSHQKLRTSGWEVLPNLPYPLSAMSVCLVKNDKPLDLFLPKEDARI